MGNKPQQGINNPKTETDKDKENMDKGGCCGGGCH